MPPVCPLPPRPSSAGYQPMGTHLPGRLIHIIHYTAGLASLILTLIRLTQSARRQAVAAFSHGGGRAPARPYSRSVVAPQMREEAEKVPQKLKFKEYYLFILPTNNNIVI